MTAKKREQSLEDLIKKDIEEPTPKSEDKKDKEAAIQQKREKKPTTMRATSIYLPPNTLKELKKLALEEEKNVNDLYLEGVKLLLTQRGLPIPEDLETKISKN